MARARLTRSVGNGILRNATWRRMDLWGGEWTPDAAYSVAYGLLVEAGYDDEMDEITEYFDGLPEELDEFYWRAHYELIESLSEFQVIRNLKEGYDQFGMKDESDDKEFRRALVYLVTIDEYAIVRRDEDNNVRLVRICDSAAHTTADLSPKGLSLSKFGMAMSELKRKKYRKKLEEVELPQTFSLEYYCNKLINDLASGAVSPRVLDFDPTWIP